MGSIDCQGYEGFNLWAYFDAERDRWNPGTFGHQLPMVEKMAVRAVVHAMLDGLQHGYKGEWQTIDAKEHIDHAIDHGDDAFAYVQQGKPQDAVEHLEHGICRMAMALIRIKEQLG